MRRNSTRVTAEESKVIAQNLLALPFQYYFDVFTPTYRR